MEGSPAVMERLVLWWRQNLAVVYVLVGSLIFALLALGWYAYGPVAAARMWGMTHGHAATLEGTKVKLPKGWREQNSVSNAELHLVRPFKWRTKIETVDVDQFTGKDVDFDRMMRTLHSLEKMATEQGEIAAVYPVSEANAARFACLEHGAADRTTLHVTCLTRDGRHVVRMDGDEGTRADFAAILTSLAGVQ